VVSHGKRADSIVKNMLLHSREGSGERTSVNINAMVEEALNLAYHGARAEKPGFNVTIAKSLDSKAGAAELYPHEMTRVLQNFKWFFLNPSRQVRYCGGQARDSIGGAGHDDPHGRNRRRAARRSGDDQILRLIDPRKLPLAPTMKAAI